MATPRANATDDGARWTRARTSNVLRRPAFFVAVTAGAFATAMLGLLLLSGDGNGDAPAALAPPPRELPDTLQLLASIAAARASLGAAESLLAEARAEGVRPSPPPPPRDTLAPALVARRDSLRRMVTALGQLLERAELAPLPASFRALGSTPPLRADARVRTLLDSLAAIERERDAFGVIGGVDPIFVTLTSRAMSVGKEIEAIAETAHASMRRELAALRPPPPPPIEHSAVDTTPIVARRDTAVQELRRSLQEFQTARARLAELTLRQRDARHWAELPAPTHVLLAAALVLGTVVGFAAAFYREARRPHVADSGEVERATGARVLAVITAVPAPPERSRRRADRETPPLINPADDGYRLLYHHVAAASPPAPLVTVMGAHAGITGTVAANIAVLSAHEARSTLLVDADTRASAVADIMRVRRSPGLADVIDATVDWAEAVVPATVGRDRTVFVVPSGQHAPQALDEAAADRVRSGLARMARRYDFVVAAVPVAPADRGIVQLLQWPDVICCARVGYTRLRDLRFWVESLRSSGTRVRGIVLWDAELPRVATPEMLVGEADGGSAEMRWASHANAAMRGEP